MKKIIFALLALMAFVSADAKRMSDLKIYINPGHGGYTSNDRPIQIYPFASNDTAGYWESKSNLYKGLHMYHILKSLGAKPYLSRTKNTEADDRSLSGIAEEANQLGVDLFFSIHSNAGEDVNYPLMLYRENVIGTPRYPENVTLSKILWKNLHSSKLSHWTRDTEYVCGDLTFYDNQWKGGLGVLRTLYVVGLLSEGGMHEHRPEAYRLMNDDFWWLEAWHFVKTIMEFYDTEDRFVTGNVAGVVYDDHNLREKDMPVSFSNYGRDRFAPINGAFVKLLDKAGNVVQSKATDNMYNGVFVFREVAPGDYTVKVTHDQYYSEEYQVSVKANEVTYNDAPLSMKRPDPLKVTSHSPDVADDELVSCATRVEMRFNYDVDVESFEKAFSITPEVDGYMRFSDSYRKVEFIPDISFDASTTYTVRLASSACTPDRHVAHPEMESDFEFSFTTRGRSRLELTDTYPTDGGVIHYQKPVLEFRFDKSIDYSKIYDQLVITDESGVSLSPNKRSCKFNTLSNGYGNVIYQLTANLTAGKKYKATLSGELRDTEKLPLNENIVVEFSATDEGREKEGEVVEAFEGSLFAGNADLSSWLKSSPTYTRSSSDKLFGSYGSKFTYVFGNYREGHAYWDYIGENNAQYYDGDVVGLHINGDFNRHDLMLGFTSGTDTKYYRIANLDFRGWKYYEVKLTGLLDSTPYSFCGIRLDQQESPVTQSGTFSIDQMVRRSGEAGVEDVVIDNRFRIENDRNELRVVSDDEVSEIYLYATDGSLVAAAEGNVMSLSQVGSGTYVVRVMMTDSVVSRKITVR